MTLREQWYRLTHPKTLEDYQQVVDLGALAQACPDLYESEVSPYLEHPCGPLPSH